MNIEYITTDIALNNSSKNSNKKLNKSYASLENETEQEIKKKETKIRSTKVQDFQIRIKVLEARQLEGNNLDPLCKIKCSNML